MANGITELGNGIAQNALVTGYKCWVRVGNTAADAQAVGFVDSMSATKNIQLQRAECCGALLSASIDPQGYSVSLSLGGFLSIPDVYKGNTNINGLGKVSLQSFNPSSTDFIAGSVATKFPYIDFYDDKEQIIIAAFDNAIAQSFQITIQGKTYAKCNISMEAIDMSSGDDYMAQTAENVD